MKTTKFLTSAFVLGSIALGTLGQAKEAAAANIVNTWQASEAVSDQYHSANHHHAFWIPDMHYDFDFEGDAFFNEYDDGTINLIGNIGAGNKKFAVDVWFNSMGNLQEGQATAQYLAPKIELNRGNHSSVTNVNDWSYYTIDSSKSLLTEIGEWYGNNDQTDTFFLRDRMGDQDTKNGKTYKGQMGLGGNGKNINEGFASWFWLEDTNTGRTFKGDINIDLVETEVASGVLSESVPEPATMSFLTLGLLGTGMGALKRKKQ
ncbi:MAG: PEP-CTERM sorting domain-containing protein [Cyanobacteria bacterium P01_H01_bin.35]